MTTHLGCIADDFTGATDLAGLLARSGVRVALRIGVPDVPPEDPATVEVIALKIRTAPVAQAVTEAIAALDWLRAAGAAQVFWKYCSTFDSTAEGNIGPVAEALMQALGAQQTIYCPAFPENGRSIYMGHLFVGEQPLCESPMKDHPLTPMRDSNLMRLLEPQVTRPVGLANRMCVAKGPAALADRLAALQQQGVAHVVTDAVADTDLATIAAACCDMPLITGGSALAAPLPRTWMDRGDLPERAADASPVAFAAGPAIVLSGSCSAMTRAQVTDFAARHPAFQLDPLVLANDGPEAALTWLAQLPAGATPLVYATAEPQAVRAAQQQLGRAAAGEIVETALARIAVAARDAGYRRFVVAGGETSGAVTGALDVTGMDVGPEIAPGVPWCATVSAGQPIAITLKSGNFGTETFFSDALARLENT